MRQIVGGELQIGETAAIAAAVEWRGLLFLSGRSAADAVNLEAPRTSFEEQARETLETIFELLRNVGSGPQAILRVACFVADRAYFESWNRIWADYFPIDPPARTTVVAELALPGLLIELEVTAYRLSSMDTSGSRT